MLSFIIATTIVTIIPGPSIVLIMLNSIQKGLMSGVLTAFGAVLADAILLVLIMSGLGTLLYASAFAYGVVKWCGVLYLIYLGFKLIKSEVKESDDIIKSSQSSFFQGMGITLLNPKIIGFFIAFFPQFLNKDEPIIPQLLILGPVFLLTVLLLFLMMAVFARSLSHFMKSYQGQVFLKNSAGLALIGCGIFAATMERI